MKATGTDSRVRGGILRNPLLSRIAAVILAGLIFPGNLPADTESLSPETQTALYEAQNAVKRREFQKARDLLTGHMTRHGPHPMIYLALGNAWYAEGSTAQAHSSFEKGAGLFPESAALCLNLAHTAYELGKYAQAGRMFEKAHQLSSPPRSSDLLYQAGASFYQAGDLKQAAAILKQLPLDEGKKDMADGLQNRGGLLIQVYMDLKDWDAAEQAANHFTAQNPLDSGRWKLLAHIRLEQKNFRTAAAALEIAYQIQKPARTELEELANLYLHINIPAKALRIFEQIFGPDPGPDQCENLAQVAAQAGHVEKAIGYLDRALAQKPLPKYHLEKGKLFYTRGEWARAIDHFSTCLRMAPDEYLAALMLGYCYLESRQEPSARTAFLKAAASEKYKPLALSALAALPE